MTKTKKLYRKDFLVGVRLEPQTYQFFSDYSLKCGRKIPEIIRVILRKFASFAKDKDMNIELMCNDFLKDLFENYIRNVNNYESGSPIKLDTSIRNVNETFVNNSNNVNNSNIGIRDIIYDISVNISNRKTVSLYLREDYFEVIRRISEAHGLSVSEFFDNLMYIFVHTLENSIRNVNKNSETGENPFIANLMDYIRNVNNSIRNVNVLEHEKNQLIEEKKETERPKCWLHTCNKPAMKVAVNKESGKKHFFCIDHIQEILKEYKDKWIVLDEPVP